MAFRPPFRDPLTSKFALVAYAATMLLALHFLYFRGAYPSSHMPVPQPTTINATTTQYGFPRKLWQTAKSQADITDEDRTLIQSWTKMNQKWRYEVLTQYTAESYVRQQFGHEKEIEETFLDLQDPILRADLIRYLVLLGDGGVYSDMDTRSHQPIEDWIPAEYRDQTRVVVGIEFDALGGPRWLDWSSDLQFCTWAIMAKPNHPLLRLTVTQVLGLLKKLAFRQGKTIAGVQPTFHEVLETTGPAAFTESVFDYLSTAIGGSFTRANVTNMTTPRLVADVLIMPINSFGSGQMHSNSGPPDGEDVLVQHMFKGSWKKDHSLDWEQNHKDDGEKKVEEQANVAQ